MLDNQFHCGPAAIVAVPGGTCSFVAVKAPHPGSAGGRRGPEPGANALDALARAGS
ncbi:MAG TPA: hypothetical protein VJM31_13550 [Vicinamibacterales bacterium]|nr:hypothetical protein [Vicinamibacterales bacterium]